MTEHDPHRLAGSRTEIFRNRTRIAFGIGKACRGELSFAFFLEPVANTPAEVRDVSRNLDDREAVRRSLGNPHPAAFCIDDGVSHAVRPAPE